MGRLRNARVATSCLACITSLLALTALPLQAQGGSEGLLLLLPIGARAVGMGESVVAQKGGSEQVWWNPAGITGDTLHEIAIHHSETVVGQGNAISYVMSPTKIGTFALSFNLLDLGTQDATDDQGQIQGTISSLDFTYALSYAFSLNKYMSLGATVKHVELRISCSGLCTDLPIGGARSNGADLGGLFQLGRLPMTVGVAVRNLGVGSGSTRPARVDIGTNYRISALDKYTKDIQVYASAGVVSTTAFDSASSRMGADIVFEKRIHVRGGYIFDHANGSGASIGFGIGNGRLLFDLARTFGGLSADGDRPPTYFSLRYLW